MAKYMGFIEYDREDTPKRAIKQRIHDFQELEKFLPSDRLMKQAARCMDCGVPHCHTFGCPVKNRIPDWNDLVYRGHWEKALQILHSTDNFPEFTGRVCPAPCEAACTLDINLPAVTIRHIELQIIEKGWREGWVQPEPASQKTGKKVAVIGSGPAGMAAAQQLARRGHDVVVFEKADRVGGLLRYGIPDFKLEKKVLDRRIEQMRAEGVTFEAGVEAGIDISVRYLMRTFAAVVIAAGSTVPRDLEIPGRQLQGIHFAMDFLVQQNRRIAGDRFSKVEILTAKDKDVVVLGGGDTGSDCVGTSRRQGAKSITQIEILPKPPSERSRDNPWPTWPWVLTTSYSQEEGCERLWSMKATEFIGENGKVIKLRGAQLKWSEPDQFGKRSCKEIPDQTIEIKADLVLLALGYLHVDHSRLLNEFDLKFDDHGCIMVDSNMMTLSPGVFAAGDAVQGASLVVHAIHSGRKAAEGVNKYLGN